MPTPLVTCSEALVAVLLLVGALGSVSIQLGQVLLRVLEVEPGALGSDFEAAVGVRSPAVVALVEEVVRVSVVDSLHAVVARAVEPALALERLGVSPAEVVVRRRVEDGPGWDDHKTEPKRHGDVLLSHLSDSEVARQVL
eukprot:CAMPEP_0185568390 /NCGR_PEP_ID=MMETSP0434-20130131/1369_1 /TAXON_ID=626734 ORGANISM="Favella taraikaensis, Strain Fe Narragansett Bay" /NCGR_SAMPLE_ID=MMETSP0434 /ASSEMBLY_ACC=CAM_ASM_000379 /LENGTH=139 /DNA_ID=CAMNT_0028182901 /DNA_START=83 /DNA_END=502 /DNA_ORIENTATION=+